MSTRFGFVSTYPPTLCGLATFTAALFTELGSDGQVVRVLDSPQRRPSAGVVGQLIAGDATSATSSAQLLNTGDVVIVQHEYGAYGGPDGAEILPLLAQLTVPSIVVLHTVLTTPTPGQRSVLEEVVALASAVVTMTATARDRLAAGYAVDMSKVSVIPHGAPVVHASKMPIFRNTQPTVLTWGLIGPGKGIEWAIAAMAHLRDLDPAPRYIIAGQTHPKVALREGEAYRNRLKEQVRDLGLTATVSFDSHYRNNASLAELVSSADAVVLPYDSTDQVTSGVLIEAVAAGKPVVATRFPHAVELLSDGGGLLVPHQDPIAIAEALRTLLTRRDVAAQMTRVAGASTSEVVWPAVAQRYRELAEQLISRRVPA